MPGERRQVALRPFVKERPQRKQDHRSSLELAIIVKDLQETKSTVRWVPRRKMIVDALAKADPAAPPNTMGVVVERD